MRKLSKNGSVREGDPFLQSGRAGGVLDEGEIFGPRLKGAMFTTRRRLLSVVGTDELCFLSKSYMTEQVIGKFVINHDGFAAQIGGHASKSGPVLGGLDLEVRVREEGWDRSQHHRADEGGHRSDRLRHDDDHAIACCDVVSFEVPGVGGSAIAELCESDGFVFIFVDPVRDKGSIIRGGCKRVDEIAKFFQTLTIPFIDLVLGGSAWSPSVVAVKNSCTSTALGRQPEYE